MNNLQRLGPSETTWSPSTAASESTPRRCSAASSTTTPSTPRRASPRRAATARSAACGAPTTAAPTGAGASTRTASSAPCGPASASRRRRRTPTRMVEATRRRGGGAGRMSASAVYEGWIRHRRFEPVEHAFRYRSLPDVPRPRGAARRARPYPALLGPAAGAGPLPPRRLHGRPGAGRWTSARATRSRPRPAPAPPARSACSPGCATSATPSTRSASTTASTAAGERVEAVVADVENIPWGERHPYVLARGEQRGPGAERRVSKRRSTSHP